MDDRVRGPYLLYPKIMGAPAAEGWEENNSDTTHKRPSSVSECDLYFHSRKSQPGKFEALKILERIGMEMSGRCRHETSFPAHPFKNICCKLRLKYFLESNRHIKN